MALIIRPTNQTDFPEIIEIWNQSSLIRPWNDPLSDLEKALANKTSTVFLASLEQKLIGTVMVGYEGHRGWMYYLAVHSDHRKKGIAAQLITAAENWLKQQDCPKIMLMIRKENENISAFYEHMGYEYNDVTVMQKWLK